MKHSFIPLAAMALALASCSNDGLVDENLDVRGNAIAFTPVVGHNSRATETTIENLGDFHVVAKAIDHNGTQYTSFLMGSAAGTDGTGVLTAETAKYDGNAFAGSGSGKHGTWKLDHDVYWPTGVTRVKFWAWTAAQSSGSNSAILPKGTANFENQTVHIEGYEQAKADLSSNTADCKDGDKHNDFVFAITDQKSASSNIDLKFQHALSQISIKAVQKDKADNDHRIVKVKGAWICNVNSKGDLSFNLEEDGTAKAEWTKHSGLNNYGSWLTTSNNLSLGTEPYNILAKDGDSNNGNLMIIPQEVKAWDKDTKTDGAYILLLCRVELKHPGTSHEGGQPVEVGVEGGYHYHQLFPVNKENKYEKEEYGFTCVPLGTTWDPGKRYEYILNICGKTTGAGIYPPEMTENEIKAIIPEAEIGNVVTARPADKNVGDNVLDNPITFTVYVDEWENTPSTWTPAN